MQTPTTDAELHDTASAHSMMIEEKRKPSNWRYYSVVVLVLSLLVILLLDHVGFFLLLLVQINLFKGTDSMPCVCVCNTTNSTLVPCNNPTNTTSENGTSIVTSKGPKNIIIMIADGFGPASQTMARMVAKKSQLPLDSILLGTSRTSSADALVTDSAAGATAISCGIFYFEFTHVLGIKTNNNFVGVQVNSKPCGTILEAAMMQKKRTGMIATKKITDATPASFSAHVNFRWLENQIAVQQISGIPSWFNRKHGIDIILGGGNCEFIPNSTPTSCRADGRNLVQEARAMNYTYVTTKYELNGPISLPVLGLFAPTHMRYSIDRSTNDPEPSLLDMATKAIELLNRDNANGFFLLIEGSKIDLAGHANDVAAHYHDIIAYNDVVQYVLNFAQRDGETLVLSTADHETGGLALGRFSGTYPNVNIVTQLKKSHDSIVADISARGDAQISAVFNEVGITNPTQVEIDAYRNNANKNQALGWIISERSRISFSTDGHTGVDVNVYAYGPMSSTFAGNQENLELGQKLARIMNVDLNQLTNYLSTRVT